MVGFRGADVGKITKLHASFLFNSPPIREISGPSGIGDGSEVIVDLRAVAVDGHSWQERWRRRRRQVDGRVEAKKTTFLRLGQPIVLGLKFRLAQVNFSVGSNPIH